MFSTVAKRLGFSMVIVAILVMGVGLIGSRILPDVPFVRERSPESPSEYSKRLSDCDASTTVQAAKGGGGGGIWGQQSSRDRREVLMNACMNVMTPDRLYTPSVGEYSEVLAANLWERIGGRESGWKRNWKTEFSYWGARALAFGLFVWLLFDTTIGRFIGWVVRGKNSE